MYTQCTECRQPYTIDVVELRSSHGMIRCKNCSAMYDALDLLNEGELPATIDLSESFAPAAINSSTPSSLASKYWSIGTGFLFVLFIWQLYVFEAYNLSQNPTLRAWLIKACSKTINCQLPDYKNLGEITILNGSFEPTNNHYIFKTAIINQALFAQQRPSIKLTLLDFSGRPFATRTFYPTDYSKQDNTRLKPNLAEKITLSIAAPSTKIGGYRFELI